MLRKVYKNPKLIKMLKRRMAFLESVAILEDCREKSGKFKELKGNRYGQLSCRLDGGYRLIFEPADEPIPRKADGGLDWKNIKAIRILSVEDYHD